MSASQNRFSVGDEVIVYDPAPYIGSKLKKRTKVTSVNRKTNNVRVKGEDGQFKQHGGSCAEYGRLRIAHTTDEIAQKLLVEFEKDKVIKLMRHYMGKIGPNCGLAELTVALESVKNAARSGGSG